MKLVTYDDGNVGRIDGEEIVRLDAPTMRAYFERGGASPLEVLAHRLNVETDDLLAFDPSDLAVVVGDELHRASSHASTSPAFRSGGNTG